MAKQKHSRLNFRYLASRYAGTFFLLAALGLLAGMVYRTLIQPVHYSATSFIDASVVPSSEGHSFDWQGRLQSWRGYIRDRRDRGLLGVNLRHAVKLAVTEDMNIDTENFSERLAELEPSASYSAVLFRGPQARWLGPTLTITQSDIARNLDFQSLAVIASDMDPPHNANGWNFSFFRSQPPIGNGVIVNPGPDDRFFKVFYQLHQALKGSAAVSPVMAWRTTIEEVAARLDRERDFAGGGGFGRQAKREIIRELFAVPALAANSLYRANGWFDSDSDISLPAAVTWSDRWRESARVELQPVTTSSALVNATIDMELNPLFFPRDTGLTRLPPLAVATLLSFIGEREREGVALLPRTESAPVVTEQPAEAQPEPEPPVTVVEPEPQAVYREVIDDIANQQRLSHISMTEETVKMARLERDASERRLITSRENDNRLSYEAIAARKRADRLRERYDDAARAVEDDTRPQVPANMAELLSRQEELLRRLTALLEYCTEEHPFVREVRRELVSLDALIGSHQPDINEAKRNEARATRLANLYLEWEAASDQADSLEERSRRQSEAVACFLDEVTQLEVCLSTREMELSQARAVPVPIRQLEVPVEKPSPVVVATVEAPAPAPTPEPVVSPMPGTSTVAPSLIFASAPKHIPLIRTERSWLPLLWGVLAGLAAAVLWLILRELFAQVFSNVGEAHRLVRLPVLAALPAYDARSFKQAAGTMRGEMVRTRAGKMQFIPAPVEFEEPPAEARRGKILPARRRVRIFRWLLGLLFILLAGFLYYKYTTTGFAQSGMPRAGELSLPSTTYAVWVEENNSEEWGNLP